MTEKKTIGLRKAIKTTITITPLLKKILFKCSLRSPKKRFLAQKNARFLVPFFTVQKRPKE